MFLKSSPSIISFFESFLWIVDIWLNKKLSKAKGTGVNLTSEVSDIIYSPLTVLHSRSNSDGEFRNSNLNSDFLSQDLIINKFFDKKTSTSNKASNVYLGLRFSGLLERFSMEPTLRKEVNDSLLKDGINSLIEKNLKSLAKSSS